MTTVKMIKQDNMYVGFEISGHSGYAQIGHDIVCAAISTLAQATMLGISNAINISPQEEITKDGYLKYTIADTGDRRMHEAQILFRTMYMALSEIEWQYKNFMKVCTLTLDVL